LAKALPYSNDLWKSSVFSSVVNSNPGMVWGNNPSYMLDKTKIVADLQSNAKIIASQDSSINSR
jgi:hypothetical protein